MLYKVSCRCFSCTVYPRGLTRDIHNHHDEFQTETHDSRSSPRSSLFSESQGSANRIRKMSFACTAGKACIPLVFSRKGKGFFGATDGNRKCGLFSVNKPWRYQIWAKSLPEDEKKIATTTNSGSGPSLKTALLKLSCWATHVSRAFLRAFTLTNLYC